ncbi:beta-lactamase domain-containing protein [Salinisphaera sp. C84B14]|uniref:MBL fold metallo-hydrolase n=1 Tax=Salinisphaera sp. C84B14 TaxID=1304155 RepID=UPI00333FFCF7
MSSKDAGLSFLCLGTGRGATAVYDGEPSSAISLRMNGHDVLLVDIGFGVVQACKRWLGAIPDTILVTHNHSDHAGELPVVLAAEAAAGRRLRVVAEPAVGVRLKAHRLHELESTGEPLAAFCDWVDTPAGQAWPLTPRLSLCLLRARHSEPCFGFVASLDGEPILGYGGDSAVDTDYYDRLFAAPNVILDARATGNDEHADFDTVAAYIAGRPTHRVWITGYGRADQAPASMTPIYPGDAVALDSGAE